MASLVLALLACWCSCWAEGITENDSLDGSLDTDTDISCALQLPSGRNASKLQLHLRDLPQRPAASEGSAKPLPQAAGSSGKLGIFAGSCLLAALLLTTLRESLPCSNSYCSVDGMRLILMISMALRSVLVSIDYTILIPSSFDLVVALGGTASSSGALLGAYSVGLGLGSVAMGLVSKHFSQSALRQFILVGAISLQLLTMVAGLMLDFCPFSPGGMLWSLYGMRFCSGFVTPWTYGIMLTLIKMTPASDMTWAYSLPKVITFNLGILIGPIMISMVPSMLPPRAISSVFTVSAALMYMMSMLYALLIVALSLVPDNLDALMAWRLEQEDKQVSEPTGKEQGTAERSGTHAGAGASAWDRKLQLCACLVYFVGRCFAVSGVEAGTSLMLEVEFHWSRKVVGTGFLFVALFTIVSCLVVMMLTKMTVVNDMVVLLAMAFMGLAGACCFFEFCASPWLLFVGDSLVFASSFSGGAMVESLGSLLSRDGSIVSLEVFQVLWLILPNACYSSSAAITRAIIASFGRNAYAGTQFLFHLIMLSCVLIARRAVPVEQKS